jgi:hypothetical protein
VNIISNIGFILLAAWLILSGLSAFVPLNLGKLLSVLAIVAGVFILLGK